MSATPSPYNKNFIVSWDEFHRDAKALAWRLLSIKQFKSLIAITRGGMVPSAIVARELGIRHIDTICLASYDEQHQGEMQILKSVPGDGVDCLLIDDLVDTGRTAKIVRQMLPKAHLATVYAKPQGLPHVDTFVTQVSQDTWIRFPWDMELNFATPIVEQMRK